MRSWRLQVRDLKKRSRGIPRPGISKKEVVASQARDLKKEIVALGPGKRQPRAKLGQKLMQIPCKSNDSSFGQPANLKKEVVGFPGRGI